MVRAALKSEFIAADGLVKRFEEIEDSYVGDDDKIADRMKPDLERLLGYWETFSGLENPDEDEQRMRILLPDVGRLPIYRWINAEERLRIFSSALADSERFGFDWGQAVYSRHVGTAYSDLGENVKALEFLETALQLHRELDDLDGEIGLIESDLSMCLGHLCRFEDAEKMAQQAVETLASEEDVSCVASATNNLGIIQYELGDYESAKASFEKSIELHDSVGMHKDAGSALGNLASLHSETGDKPKALELAGRSLANARKFDDQNEIDVRKLVIAGIYREIEKPEVGLEVAREVIESSSGLRAQETKCYAMLEAADCLYDLDDLDNAIQWLDQVIEVAKEFHFPTGLGAALSLKGRVLTDQKLIDEAMAMFDEANDLFREANDRSGLAGVCFHQAIAKLMKEDLTGSHASAMEALALYDEIGSGNAQMVRDWIKNVLGK